MRPGGRVSQTAKELVPGDVLLLDAGSRIPADARLLYTANLEVEEAALTGESMPVHKQTGPLADPSLPMGDRTNMVFMGGAVNGTHGRGEAAVTATGMETQMGAIATMIQAVEEEQTPLQRELTRVGKQLGLLVLVVALVVIVTGVLTGGRTTAGGWNFFSLAWPWPWRLSRKGCPPLLRRCWLWVCGVWPAVTQLCAACLRWKPWAAPLSFAATRPETLAPQ